MITRIYGDIHGQLLGIENDWNVQALEPYEPFDKAIQIGDFGIGFGQSSYWEDKVKRLMETSGLRFIRGNHDNPHRVAEFPGFIKDGTVESFDNSTVMYIGGAYSIDKEYRISGRDWWPEEEISLHDWYNILDTYKVAKPDVVISHDGPEAITKHMFLDAGLGMSGYEDVRTRTAMMLQTLFAIHQPKHWFFGHWHVTKHYSENGTEFHCVGADDYLDFNFEKLEIV